jgi:phosphoglucosamine mutase
MQVVGTQMTNLGLEHALAKFDMTLHRAKVGDRYVMEMLNQTGGVVGGESSGHIICLDKTTTGDGIVAALQVLAEMQETQHSLHELRSAVTKYPQSLINVELKQKIDLDNNAAIQDEVARIETVLGNEGRVLLRASGTEPVIRVMVEGRDAPQTNQLAKELADFIRGQIA